VVRLAAAVAAIRSPSTGSRRYQLKPRSRAAKNAAARANAAAGASAGSRRAAQLAEPAGKRRAPATSRSAATEGAIEERAHRETVIRSPPQPGKS
jgi:hypothetical protein